METTALLPLRRNACCGFLSPLKYQSPSAGFEPGNHGHATRYITEDIKDTSVLTFCFMNTIL
jgi:hypothetical protein